MKHNKISKDFILEFKKEIYEALQRSEGGLHPSQVRLADEARKRFDYGAKTQNGIIWNAIAKKFYDI